MPRKPQSPQASTVRRLIQQAERVLTPERRRMLEAERADVAQEYRFWARQEYALSREEFRRKSELEERLRALDTELERDRTLRARGA